MPIRKRFIVMMVAAVAALSLGGCSIKSDDGKDDDNQTSVPTTPSVPSTPQTTPTTPATTPTEPTTTTPPAGRTQEDDINGITVTIRRYFDAGRKGNASEWCGQQSDALLEKSFGGLSECISSDVANKADGDIPPGRDLNFDNAINLDGDSAKAKPSTLNGSTTYNIDLVYEGSNGGWAVNKIDNNG